MIRTVHGLAARIRSLRACGTGRFLDGDYRVDERKLFGRRLFQARAVLDSERQDYGGEYQTDNPHHDRRLPDMPHNRRY
ncbi:hypothetical protein IU448_10265 [Nocardia flavorosea]|uniref:hypothetical protein n=1 Tax=Nocardia flavorosea TaxID=53429 RepID=UPI001895E27D|nr:hypothetical protein [Nocardia flavorosea]MBF6349406.1 hypothetical protein [Nocardia flavorosea]